MSLPRRPWRSLRHDRDAELTLIAEASHWLADVNRARRPDTARLVMAMLERQQRVAANRARDLPVDR